MDGENSPSMPFKRYVDDGIVHFRTEVEAKETPEKLKKRLNQCKLELRPTKTVRTKIGQRNTH